MHVHINVHVCVYDQYCTWMAQVSGLSCGCCPCPRPSSPPSTYPFLPSLPGTMLRAPASVQCSLHQLPAGRPSCNSFLPLSMKAMVFQRGRHSRLVAMADCFCCCPSPCWPHKSVWQSTGPLKPLIEFMVLGIISCFLLMWLT